MGPFDFPRDQSDVSAIGGYAEATQMGTKTIMNDTTNAAAPAVPQDETREPLANIGMQWLVLGMAPGVDFLAGADTRREAHDFILNDRPTPDRHDYFAVIKARDLFGEVGLPTNRKPDDEEDDDLKPHEMAERVAEYIQQLDDLVGPEERDRLIQQATEALRQRG